MGRMSPRWAHRLEPKLKLRLALSEISYAKRASLKARTKKAPGLTSDNLELRAKAKYIILRSSAQKERARAHLGLKNLSGILLVRLNFKSILGKNKNEHKKFFFYNFKRGFRKNNQRICVLPSSCQKLLPFLMAVNQRH